MRTKLTSRWIAGPALAGLILVLGIPTADAADDDYGQVPPVPGACELNACYKSCADANSADQCYQNCDQKFMRDCNVTRGSKTKIHMSPRGGMKTAR